MLRAQRNKQLLSFTVGVDRQKYNEKKIHIFLIKQQDYHIREVN